MCQGRRCVGRAARAGEGGEGAARAAAGRARSRSLAARCTFAEDAHARGVKKRHVPARKSVEVARVRHQRRASRSPRAATSGARRAPTESRPRGAPAAVGVRARSTRTQQRARMSQSAHGCASRTPPHLGATRGPRAVERVRGERRRRGRETHNRRSRSKPARRRGRTVTPSARDALPAPGDAAAHEREAKGRYRRKKPPPAVPHERYRARRPGFSCAARSPGSSPRPRRRGRAGAATGARATALVADRRHPNGLVQQATVLIRMTTNIDILLLVYFKIDIRH